MPTRIALTGKGGVGKTSIAGTLARLLARGGHRVIAVDGDLNPNLGITLGLSTDDAGSLEPIPKDAVELKTLDDGDRQLLLARTPQEFLDDVAVPTPDGVSLVLMGRPDHAGHG